MDYLLPSTYQTNNTTKKIRIDSARLVKPLYEENSPPTMSTIPLSVFDEVTYDIQVSLVFAYYQPAPPNIALEIGLRRALALCRSWAGRLGQNDVGHPVLLLNDEGVGFIEAYANCTLHEALPFNSSSGVSLEYVHPRSSGVSQLAQIQLTRFTCGSLVIGLTHHHLVGDGPSMCKFMLSWCQASRGVQISPTPLLFNNSLFTPRVPPLFEFDHGGVEYMSRENQQAYSHDDPIAKDVVFQKIHFSKDFLSNLKSIATMKQNFSTFEVLLAHLWRALTKARGLDENETTQVRISVDGRVRMNPKVPHYFGNLMLWAFPTSNVKQLLNNSLSQVAQLIHEEVAKVNDNYFKSFIDFSKHKVEEEDLVPTAAAEKPVLSPVEGLIFLLPSLSGDGSIDAFVGLFKKNVGLFTKSCYSIPISSSL
ncbi:acetyltransferase [Lithospermum erythrorhizon]|uniref:Acetyltransferase n=1 Tax=Lithospermum erythrorhizon TaxID=34254 RepID=A0AAV3QPH4_LITER